MIKVLFIINNLSNGGAEKFVYELATYINKNRQYEATILLLEYRRIIKKDVNIVFPKTKIKRFFHFWHYFSLFKQINKISPDIIHSSLIGPDLIVGIYKLFNPQKKVISTIHSYDQNRFHKILIKHKILFKLQGVLYKRFNSIICVSDHIKQYITDRYNLNDRNLKTIYLGLKNISKYPRFSTKKKYSGKLLFVGRLMPVKNISILIKVLTCLPSHYNLTIIGEGPMREQLETEIRQNNIEHQVNILGYIKNVYKNYHNYDILIIPSFHESFSFVALEGLIVGMPVIATNNGGIREIFGPNLQDFLFNPYDPDELYSKIIQIEKRYDYYIDRIKKEYDRFLSLSFEGMANEYMALYKNLIK